VCPSRSDAESGGFEKKERTSQKGKLGCEEVVCLGGPGKWRADGAQKQVSRP